MEEQELGLLDIQVSWGSLSSFAGYEKGNFCESVRFHFNQSGKGNIKALIPSFSSGPTLCLIYFSSAGWRILKLSGF